MKAGDIVKVLWVERPEFRFMHDRASRDCQIHLAGSRAGYLPIQACRYPGLFGAEGNRLSRGPKGLLSQHLLRRAGPTQPLVQDHGGNQHLFAPLDSGA